MTLFATVCGDKSEIEDKIGDEIGDLLVMATATNPLGVAIPNTYP